MQTTLTVAVRSVGALPTRRAPSPRAIVTQLSPYARELADLRSYLAGVRLYDVTSGTLTAVACELDRGEP